MDFDDARVGLELEFVAAIRLDKLPDKLSTYQKVRGISHDTFIDLMYRCGESMRKQLDTLIRIDTKRAGKRLDRNEEYISKTFKRITPGRYMALLGIPDHLRFYRPYRDVWHDRTDEVRELIAAKVDQDILTKKLNTLYVKVPKTITGKHEDHVVTENHFMELLAKTFERKLGLKIKRQFAGNRSRRREFGKGKFPIWHIKEESLDCDVYGWNLSFGYELVTPPLHPAVAVVYSRMILEVMRETHEEFTLVIKDDCGIHVNVSVSGYTPKDYSPCYIALMFDDESFMTKFGRLDPKFDYLSNNATLEKTVNHLCEQQIITLSDLKTDKGFRHVCEIIDACADQSVFRSIDYEKVDTYCYLEHRSGGGSNYQYNPDGLADYINALVEFTLTYKNRWKNPNYLARLRDLMIRCGAVEKSTTPINHWVNS